MSKLIQNIPQMDDNKLRGLFLNAFKFILKGERVEEAEAIIAAIQTTWAARVKAYDFSQYKADTPDTGMLKALGYHVGERGEPEALRRKILDYIMTGTLPPAGSPPYYAEWGEPLTRQRYRKLHRVIRVLASSAAHFENMEKANREWEDDLVYLERVWDGRVL